MSPDDVFMCKVAAMAATARWGDDDPSQGEWERRWWTKPLDDGWGDDVPSLPYERSAPIPSDVPKLLFQ